MTARLVAETIIHRPDGERLRLVTDRTGQHWLGLDHGVWREVGSTRTASHEAAVLRHVTSGDRVEPLAKPGRLAGHVAPTCRAAGGQLAKRLPFR